MSSKTPKSAESVSDKFARVVDYFLTTPKPKDDSDEKKMAKSDSPRGGDSHPKGKKSRNCD